MKPFLFALAAALLIAGCSSSRQAQIDPVVAAPPIVAAPVPEPSPEPPEPAPPVEMTAPAPPPVPVPPAPEEPVARPAPRPTPPPPVARPAPPAPVPEPPPAPPPVVAARVPHEDQVAQELSARLARTQDVVGKIDPSKLSRDQREIFSGILDFIAKAKEAFQAKDIPRAQVLAEKASKLADDLAQSVKR
jgi:outer membrane biosynthesis protein TonB